MKKYELIDEVGTNLKRIVALKDIESIGVKKGDKGGLVESEKNLSQDGDCWVFKYAKVVDNAKVWGNAVIHDRARIKHSAEVFENAEISGYAMILHNAKVSGNCCVKSDAIVCYATQVNGNSIIY